MLYHQYFEPRFIVIKLPSSFLCYLKRGSVKPFRMLLVFGFGFLLCIFQLQEMSEPPLAVVRVAGAATVIAGPGADDASVCVFVDEPAVATPEDAGPADVGPCHGGQRVSAVVPFVNVDGPGCYGDRGDEEEDEERGDKKEEEIVGVSHDEVVELS